MKQTTLIGRILLGALYASTAAAILAAVMFGVSRPTANETKVFIGGKEITVIIADTKELRENGLSGYKEINSSKGMLFVFSDPGFYGFWMKNMRFPIDIIWFDANRRIVDVWENATPESYPKVHTPVVPAQYVLEVGTGYFANHALKHGDILEIGTSSRYNE